MYLLCRSLYRVLGENDGGFIETDILVDKKHGFTTQPSFIANPVLFRVILTDSYDKSLILGPFLLTFPRHLIVSFISLFLKNWSIADLLLSFLSVRSFKVRINSHVSASSTILSALLRSTVQVSLQSHEVIHHQLAESNSVKIVKTIHLWIIVIGWSKNTL